MKYAYTGEPVPTIVPTAAFEGWTDRKKYHMRHQLYRAPHFLAQALYRLGQWAAAFAPALLLTSCALFGDPAGVDFAKVANTVDLYRQDVAALAPLASPELQAKLAELDAAVLRVEGALQAAGAGGPVHDVTTAAQAALAVAGLIADSLPSENDLRFAIAVAQVILNHVAAAEFAEVK